MSVAATGKAPLSIYEFKSNESLVDEVNEAIKKGTLKSCLESVDLEDLVQQLSNDWDKAPYLEILKVCDAKIAMYILADFATNNTLRGSSDLFHAIQALEVFNKSDRLPIFIDALRLGRETSANSININNLLHHHNHSGPFKGKLPPFVHKALQIEFLRNYCVQLSAQGNIDHPWWMHVYKTWDSISQEERVGKMEQYQNKAKEAFLSLQNDFIGQPISIHLSDAIDRDYQEHLEELMKTCDADTPHLKKV